MVSKYAADTSDTGKQAVRGTDFLVGVDVFEDFETEVDKRFAPWKQCWGCKRGVRIQICYPWAGSGEM